MQQVLVANKKDFKEMYFLKLHSLDARAVALFAPSARPW